MADGPYCEMYYLNSDGIITKKVTSYTLGKVLTKHPYCIRLNRKVAINSQFIKSTSGLEVITSIGEKFKFSRRRFKKLEK